MNSIKRLITRSGTFMRGLAIISSITVKPYWPTFTAVPLLNLARFLEWAGLKLTGQQGQTLKKSGVEPANSTGETPGSTTELCGDVLIEIDWLEGFTCGLPKGHEPPHRDATDANSVNASVDARMRHYVWAYEWVYGDGPST